MENVKIIRIWFENNSRLYGETDDGRTLWQPLSRYPHLLHASREERNDYRINASGIKWQELDEEVSFGSFGNGEPELPEISKI